MKLCTFSDSANQPKVGVLIGDLVVDLAKATIVYRKDVADAMRAQEEQWFATMLQLLGHGAPAIKLAGEMSELAVKSNGQTSRPVLSPVGNVRLHAPIPRPGKILAAGRNYYDHLEEAKQIWKERGRTVEKPRFPPGFAKMPSGVIGPEDTILAPRQTKQLDYEAELAIVIGRTAKYVSEADALEYVAGYTIVNDVSARDWQLNESQQANMMVVGKNFDTFCPQGPVLVTRDEIPNPDNLRLELSVNGEIRQSSNTNNMVFNTAQLISHFSMTKLEPGDLIITGTPAGVAAARRPDPAPYFLKPGDVVEVTIESIGTLRNPVAAEP